MYISFIRLIYWNTCPPPGKVNIRKPSPRSARRLGIKNGKHLCFQRDEKARTGLTVTEHSCLYQTCSSLMYLFTTNSRVLSVPMYNVWLCLALSLWRYWLIRRNAIEHWLVHYARIMNPIHDNTFIWWSFNQSKPITTWWYINAPGHLVIV